MEAFISQNKRQHGLRKILGAPKYDFNLKKETVLNRTASLLFA